MHTTTPFVTLLMTHLIATTTIAADGEPVRARLLAQAEQRIKAIYEQREFNANSFSGIWAPRGATYLKLETVEGAKGSQIVSYEPGSGKSAILVASEKLVEPGSSRHLKIADFASSPTGNRFLLRVERESDHHSNSASHVDSDPEYWVFDVDSHRLRRVESGVYVPCETDAFSPDGRRLLGFRAGNLCMFDIDSGGTTSLTKDAVPGTLDYGSARWSPDGRNIVFIQTDSSAVPLRAVLVPGDPTYRTFRGERFARIGGPIPALRIGVTAAEEGDIRWVDLSDKPATFYLSLVRWAANSDELIVDKLNRYRNEREWLLVNRQTGSITRSFADSDPAWVDAIPPANAGLDWISEGRAYVVLSERDGWRRAYIISRDGSRATPITSTGSDVIARGPVDEKSGWFYYLASPTNATQRYLFRARLDGTGSPERLTPDDHPGSHTYVFSPDCEWAFHTYSSFDRVPVTDLIHLPDHRSVRMLEDNAALLAKVKPLIPRPTELLTLDIGNGVNLDAWLIKPRDFVPEKKYPLFVFVYGEPAGQTVLDDWNGGQRHTMYHRAVADMGYVVVSIDNRGTPAPKGAAWRRAVFGSLGPLSTEEQAAGLKTLAKQCPYVDLTRVGIWGWSGGGSNTLNAMFRKPDQYHVGIAVVPKPQTHLYNAGYQEVYMHMPEDNSEGYRQAAPINFAEGLRGNLLIVVGSGETNTHLENTEGVVDRLIELGKQFDYMVYPNRDHGLREGKGTQSHLRMLMIRYLVEHLPPGPR